MKRASADSTSSTVMLLNVERFQPRRPCGCFRAFH